MNFFESLELTEPVRIAIVGAGGKTTALFTLARQMHGKAWVTTTTHLGTDQLDLADRHFTLARVEDIQPAAWLAQKVTLLTGERTPDDRVRSPAPKLLDEVAALAEKHKVSLVVEADGARSHAIKAPGDNEPVIPAWADAVIVVVGLSAIGKPLSPEWVHRAEQFARLSDIAPGSPITLEGTIRMLLDPSGGLKGMPAGCRKIVLFNQVDTHPVSELDLKKMRVLQPGFDKVLVGELARFPEDIIIVQ